MRIIVTDGDERAALAVTRALGRRGHELTVVSASGRSLAGCSRFAHAERRAASPLTDPAAFAEDVVRAASECRAEAIMPIGEAAVMAVLGVRHRFTGACIPFPTLETFRAVSDKALLAVRARELGIALPEQRVIASREALAGLGSERLPFPLVAKPARSVAGNAATGLHKLRVRHVPDAAALERLVAELPDAAFPLLMQQRIIGPGTGIFMLVWQGELRAVFAHRRLREKPPSGGVSVYSESVTPDADLVEQSRRLLHAFGWQGVAMVEYKRDAASGVPYLMEVNGRFWGSLQLAIDSGVDFPALLLDCAVGTAPSSPPRFRSGQRLRWLLGDLDHLLMRLKRSPRELDLPPGAPGRARAVLDFLTSWRPGQRSESWRIDDPKPFLHEVSAWFGDLRGRRQAGD